MNRPLLPPHPAGRLFGLLLCSALVACGWMGSAAHAQNDLSVFRVSSDVYVERGDRVYFTYVVTNDLGTDVDDVAVRIDLPAGLRYLSHFPLSQSFNPATGEWAVGDIRYYEPQRVVTLELAVEDEGILVATAEVVRMSGTDIDSAPDNGALDEDDIVSACVSVPIRAECGQSVRLSAPGGYSDYRWFHDGTLLVGVSDTEIFVGLSGTYSYAVGNTTATCVLGSCCSALVTFDSVSVDLSQPTVCTGGLDTVTVSMPATDTVHFTTVYTWASVDDPALRFLSCTDCPDPLLVVDAPYPGDSLRYVVDAVTTDAFGQVVCRANATISVGVWQAPAIAFATPAYACAEDCVTLTVTTDLPTADLTWSGPNLKTSTGPSVQYCPTAVSDYTPETFIVTATGLDGCVRVDSVVVTTMPSFEIFASAEQTLCQFLPADLYVRTGPDSIAADSVEIVWTELPANPNAGGNLLASTGYRVTTDTLDPGSYRFRVSVRRVAPNGDRVCTYEAETGVDVESDCVEPRLGGFAWRDGNGDGIRQSYEEPLERVLVELYRAGLGNTGRTRLTDGTGFYEFDGLWPGDYYVVFAPQPSFTFAPRNVGPDEFLDSDVDAAGRSGDFFAFYDEAVHLVSAGYVADCNLALVNVSAAPSDCGATAGALSFDVSGAVGDIAIGWSPRVSSGQSATGLAAGDYVVTVYDALSECTLETKLTVPGTSNFQLTTSSAPAACPMGRGGSVTAFTTGGTGPFQLDLRGPDSGRFVANKTPYTLRDLPGGNYSVTVTDASGCTRVSNITVGENELLLSLDTANVVLGGCDGARDGSFDVAVGSFSGRYDLRLNGQIIANRSTRAVISVAAQSAGTKTLELTDGNECVQVLTFELLGRGPRIDPATVLVTDVTCFGGPTGGLVSGVGQPLDLFDAAGQLVGMLPQNALAGGTYTLVDRSVPGCTTSLDVTITEPGELTLAYAAAGSDCDRDNGTITVRVAGGSPPYALTWDRGLPADTAHTGLAPGDYRLDVRDAAGCSAAATINVEDLCTPLACRDFFTADTLVVETDQTELDWCIANFFPPTRQRFTLDGVDVSTGYCTRDELVYYNFAGLPGDGQDGPYTIEFFYGGDKLVVAEQVDGPADFARVLDAADHWGRWRYDSTENTVTGGQPGRPYGELEVTHLTSGITVYLTPEILRGEVSATVGLAAPGAYTLRTVGGADGCRDSIHVIVRAPDPCAARWQPDATTVRTPYCDQARAVCLDVPFALLDDHTLRLDGVEYTGRRKACAASEDFYYDLSGLDLTGEFFIDAWRVDGRFFNGRVASVGELAARLTAFDNESWVYDEALGVVRGGAAGKSYKDLRLRIGGERVSLSTERGIDDGTEIEVPAGTHRAELVGPDGCVRSFRVAVDCSTDDVPARDTVTWTINLGYADTFCVDLAELTARIRDVEDLCLAANGERALVRPLEDGCFGVEGYELGTDTLCVRACDENGVCDTTIVLLDVVDPATQLFPLAVGDYDSVLTNGTLPLDLLANDLPRGALTSFEVVEYPREGRISRFADSLVYTPDVNYCGTDALVYEICNAYGCDTALVTIEVKCDGLIIFSGFSPNNDDVNETFTVLGIGAFPGNRMQVYNRYGNLVFEQDDYDNSWRGTYFDGDDLPEGTYFYVFDDGAGARYTGYVYLRR